MWSSSLPGFHPFQGRPSFGPGKTPRQTRRMVLVSIPFREDLHSDDNSAIPADSNPLGCFHPFQGRPSFGHVELIKDFKKITDGVSIPFREDLHSDLAEFIKILEASKQVSIPFREDLHSDFDCSC